VVSKSKRTGVVPAEDITRSIVVLRGQRVILDSDLAAIYGVTTGRLNEAVKRNLDRFPQDFMLRLSAAEHATLISQIATSKPGRGGRRKLPWAFTEHGAIQAANVLNSRLAVQMGVYVVRAFIQLRDLLTSNKELARRVDELEARLEKRLTTHDEAIVGILRAIRELMNPPQPKRRPIGFTADLEEKS
jgi:hypothetical protein